MVSIFEACYVITWMIIVLMLFSLLTFMPVQYPDLSQICTRIALFVCAGFCFERILEAGARYCVANENWRNLISKRLSSLSRRRQRNAVWLPFESYTFGLPDLALLLFQIGNTT